MGVKEAVSQNYLSTQKALHASKTIPDERHVIVIGSDRSGNIGAAIARELKGREMLVDEYNITTLNVLDRALGTAIRAFEPDSIVFANGESHLDWFEDMPEQKIVDVLDNSLRASIVGAQTFVRETMGYPFRRQIVFIGSMAYRSVLNGSAVYCAAKAGLAHFARCLAWELAPKGYDVYCVHPSNTEGTPMTEETIRGLMRYRDLSREDAEAYWGASLPRARWLQPENIADLVAFLLEGGAAGYLAGTNLDLGGGQR